MPIPVAISRTPYACNTSSLSFIPSQRESACGAATSTAPSAMLNQPSPSASFRPGCAAWSGLVRGSCRHLCLSPVRLEHDFDAAVFLVAERLIHVGPILESDPVRNYERRIDFSSLDTAQ